jgi:TP901 family phage tail tape measure protein
LGDSKVFRIVIDGNADGAAKAARSTGNAVLTLAEDTERANTRMGGSFELPQKAATGFGKTVAGLGGMLATAGIVKQIADVGGTLERNLNTLHALAPDADLKRVQDQLQAMRPDLAAMGDSTSDASTALDQLVMAGQSVDQALQSLRPTLQLAVGGEMDVGDAAALVANTLNMFHMSADKAGDVANDLANAANISSADVSQLADALSQSGSVAGQAGLSLSQTVAILAELSNKGLQGADAGTSLKTTLLRLTAPTNDAAALMKKLGINVYDAHGKMLPMPEIIGSMHDALGKLAPAQRAAAMQTIFGTDAIRAANVIADNGADVFTDYTSKVTRAGAVQELAAAKTAGFGGALNRLKANAESVGAAIYMKVGPPLGSALNTAMDLAPKAEAAVGRYFNRLTGSGSLFASAKAGASDFFSTLVHGAKDVPAEQSGPVRFAAAIRTELANVSPKVQAFFNIVGQKAAWVGGVLVNQLLPSAERMGAKLLPVFEQWARTVETAAEAVWRAVDWAVGVVQDLWRRGGAQLLSETEGFFSGIVAAVEGALKIIRGIADLFIAIFTGNWSKAWEGLKLIFAGALQALQGIFLAGWHLLRAAFDAALAGLAEAWSICWNGIKDFFGGILGDHGLKGLWNDVANWFVGKFADFRAMVSAVPKDLARLWDGCFDGLKAAWSGVIQWVRDTWNGSIGGFGFDIPSWVPGIGGESWTIPKLASGGVTLTGGSVWVGERGPELLTLPPGASVRPLTRPDMLPAAAGEPSGLNVAVTVNVAGSVRAERDLAKAVAVAVRDEIRQIARRNGGRTGL